MASTIKKTNCGLCNRPMVLGTARRYNVPICSKCLEERGVKFKRISPNLWKEVGYDKKSI